MNQYETDSRIVLTLDAGGTNFVFSAVQGNKQLGEALLYPSQPGDLDLCINTIKEGFLGLIDQLPAPPSAISFAFPGPADYHQGIIGNLPNLPAFRGGVPLGPILSNYFKLPVFIQNDGNLFAYGEATSGFLPQLNKLLETAESSKRYQHLIAVTLGTGFGGGIVVNGQLLTGDNSNGGEVWLMRNLLFPRSNVEETIGVSSLSRRYDELSGMSNGCSPKDIFEIGMGKQPGDKGSALKVFSELGQVLGEALTTLVNLIDGCVVIGGGIAASYELFMPSLIKQMEQGFTNEQPRMVIKPYNIEDPVQRAEFLDQEEKQIKVDEQVYHYHPEPKTAIGVTRLGTSNAISIGAYNHALNNLDHS